MPQVLVDEAKGLHEISVTVKFTSSELEQAFKKALVDSFAPEYQKARAAQGQCDVCVDCQVHSDGSLTLTGLADDLNLRLHAPPMIIPESMEADADLMARFWKEVGDVIYAGGKVSEFRQRDAALRARSETLKRSEAHQALFVEVNQIHQKLQKTRMHSDFIKSFKEKDYALMGKSFYSPSAAAIWDESILAGIENHPDFPSIQEEFLRVKAEAAARDVESTASNFFGVA